MKPRFAALLLLSIAGLFLVGAGLSLRLLRAGLRTATLATEQRLQAIGLTTAHALAQGVSPALLPVLARDNHLEGAYLLDESLRPLRHGTLSRLSFSLLRIDPDRALRAMQGQPSIGPAYRLDIEDADLMDGRANANRPNLGKDLVLAGYFPVRMGKDGAYRLLVLEAGTEFGSLPAQLQSTAWASFSVAFGLSSLCIILVFAALRAAVREQRLTGEAERGQVVREMAAMVAHEIRNPLGTIRAGAELLHEQAASPSLISDILSEVSRLQDLTTLFLQFSRDPPLTVGDVDLVALCDELCERLRRENPDAEALRIKRQGDSAVSLRGDADRLRQVLLNLGLNAVQAMQGRGELNFVVSKLPDGGAELRVIDNGPGFSSQSRQSLFRPFYTTKASGTGLGLLVSRRIIEKHGGTLILLDETEPKSTLVSSSCRGACFVLRLPSAPAKFATT